MVQGFGFSMKIQGFTLGVPVLEPLISSFCESRAPVAPVYFKRASRPLVGVRTLRGSHLFEPGARGSLLLGKGQGHLMPAVAATVSRRGRAFLRPRGRARSRRSGQVDVTACHGPPVVAS
jgi:hypothetical protein